MIPTSPVTAVKEAIPFFKDQWAFVDELYFREIFQ